MALSGVETPRNGYLKAFVTALIGNKNNAGVNTST